MPLSTINFMNASPAAITAAALIGAVLGSFYACAVYRYIAGQTLTNPPRSMCPECGHKIKWYENIPLVSFFLLRGKCSECRKPISPMYPVIESVSILWAILLMFMYGPSTLWIMYMFFGGLMIVASFIDLKTFILPDIITIPGSIAAIPCAALFTNVGWEGALLGAVLGGGMFWSLRLLYRGLKGVEGLGLGDVKIMCMIGALAGPQNLPLVITIAAFSGLCAGLIMMLVKKREYGSMIPFGPFLALGAMLSILYAEPFWLWYLLG
ncbi:A24 family peptidase [Maridesulfovibrio ferrireducens]|uniref:prepilin peptidase n=1 Tax=Maridesulfovibrio ferrireducens TaxID=246191 RepID=UPI001A2D6345|nr:A24 family peptidase [Maridesulfovibrio ferrireducens]MBI9112181.1 prepilin peptidase [Maridesulfovibrio ferrireducens]